MEVLKNSKNVMYSRDQENEGSFKNGLLSFGYFTALGTLRLDPKVTQRILVFCYILCGGEAI